MEQTEGIDYVSCKICGWVGKQITTAHLGLVHHIKAANYKEMFPNAQMTCEKSKAKMSKSQLEYQSNNPEAAAEHGKRIKENWKDPEKREYYLKAFQDRPPPTEEQKRRISETLKSKHGEPWKHLSEKYSGEKNPFFGKTHSKETRDKLSEGNTKRLKEAYSNGTRTSPFEYLGRFNSKSRYEEFVFQEIKGYGFVFDFGISFPKGLYSVDFALVDKKFGIELDSELHKNIKTQKSDHRKDEFLKSLGWKIIRVSWNKETPEQVWEKVKEVLYENQINKKSEFKRYTL